MSNEIYAGLALAREKFPPIIKDRIADTGKYTYAYADLQTVLEAVTGPLREQGLEIIQTVQLGCLETSLVMVASDCVETIESRIELPVGATSQALGSAITYARRYAIVTMLGLVTEEDEDGSVASGITARTSVRDLPIPKAPPAPEGWESDEMALAAHNALRDRIIALPDDFAEQCVAFRKTHGWPLTAERFDELETIVRLAEG